MKPVYMYYIFIVLITLNGFKSNDKASIQKYGPPDSIPAVIVYFSCLVLFSFASIYVIETHENEIFEASKIFKYMSILIWVYLLFLLALYSKVLDKILTIYFSRK